MKINFFNTNESKNTFLKEYWNRKHYVFKNGISNIFQLDRETITDLVKDEDIESRIILNQSKRELFHGPFEEDFIKDALSKDFTFIIHDLNSLFEEINKLEQAVSFISNWEFDDVICTYSNTNMSLGAHFDPYNVFIVQATGQRKWLLDYSPNNEWREDEEIKVLKEFNPEVEIILNPGDVLYIPPKVAHHGISLSESLSYSIGFKSIQFKTMAMDYLRDTIDELSDLDIFVNSENNKNLYPSNLKNEFKEYLIDKILIDKNIEQFTTNYLTNSKTKITYDFDKVDSFDFTLSYQRDSHIKWIFKDISKDNNRLIELTINQNKYEVSINAFNYIQTYLNKSSFEVFEFLNSNDSEIENLLIELINSEIFFEYFD